MLHINLLSRQTHSWSKLTQLHWVPATFLGREESTQKSLGTGKKDLPLVNLSKWPFLPDYSSEAGNTPLGTWQLVPPVTF